MMKKTILTLLVLLPSLLTAQTVAVIDFENNTGKKSLQFLSYSLAESISNVMARDKKIRTLERNQIKQIIKELELRQTGLFDTDSLGDIKFMKADYLVLGSYQGDKKITAIIKAVEIKSAAIIASFKAEGDIESIMTGAEMAAVKILAYIKGENLADISITSIPSGADVYIDGMLAGTTPLINYKAVMGRQEITLTKKGYKKHTETLSIKGTKQQLDVKLHDEGINYRTNIGIAYSYFFTMGSELGQENIFLANISQSFDMLSAGIEYSHSAGGLSDTYSYNIAYGTSSDTRDYSLQMINLVLRYSPFTELEYISPYAGLYAGYMMFNESGRNGSFFSEKETTLNSIIWGGIIGVSILPLSRVSIEAEARYTGPIIKPEREIIKSVYFGEAIIRKEKIAFSGISIGAGLTFHINWGN